MKYHLVSSVNDNPEFFVVDEQRNWVEAATLTDNERTQLIRDSIVLARQFSCWTGWETYVQAKIVALRPLCANRADLLGEVNAFDNEPKLSQTIAV